MSMRCLRSTASRRMLSARVSALLDLLKQPFPNGTSDELAILIVK